MVSAIKDLGMGWRKNMGVRDLFKGSDTGSSSLWVGEICDEPPHGTVPGGFPE